MLYSPFASLTQEIYGKLHPPADVTNFTMVARIDLANLKWDPVTDLDVIRGGTYWIRHTSNTTGVTWAGSSDITKNVPGTLDNYSAPLLSGTYLIKALDSSGNESGVAAKVTSNVADLLGLNAVQTSTQHPLFGSGTADKGINDTNNNNITFDSSSNTIRLTNPSLGEGYYYFTDQKLDLGTVYTSRITCSYASTGYAVADFFDSATGNFDARAGGFDGTDISGTNASLEIRTTSLNPTTAAEADWSDWGSFFVGDYAARGIQFRAKLKTDNSSNNLQISNLSVTIDMPDTIKRDTGLTTDSGTNSGTKVVTYAAPFKATPNVAITLQNANTGDYYTISSDSATGFTITFYNSSSTATQKSFNWMSLGY
jgi:hypothetical protein